MYSNDQVCIKIGDKITDSFETNHWFLPMFPNGNIPYLENGVRYANIDH